MFFCRENELEALDQVEEKENSWLWLPPAVHVDAARLTEALDSAGRFCGWLEDELTGWRYPGARKDGRTWNSKMTE